MIASAARMSDHVLLLGSSVPKVVEQKTLLKGVDLSLWGRRREIVCKSTFCIQTRRIQGIVLI
jgi:hypothetical protein